MRRNGPAKIDIERNAWLCKYAHGSDIIWPNAFIHSVWNMCMGSGILYLSNEMSENSIFNYVLDTNSFLISCGDFGFVVVT